MEVEGAKGVAAKLIRDEGFEPVSVEPLRIPCYTGPFVQLEAQIAYEADGSPELAYRFNYLEH